MYVESSFAFQYGFKNDDGEFRRVLIKGGDNNVNVTIGDSSDNAKVSFDADHSELKSLGQCIVSICPAVFNELNDSEFRKMLFERFKSRIKVGDTIKTPEGHESKVKRIEFDTVYFEKGQPCSKYDLWAMSPDSLVVPRPTKVAT